MFKNFTQGGQVSLHSLRMLRQVVKSTLAVSLLLGTMTSGFLLSKRTDLYQWDYVLKYYIASVLPEMGTPDNPSKVEVFVPNQGNVKVTKYVMLTNPYFLKHIAYVHKTGRESLKTGGIVSLVIALLMTLFWIRRGKSQVGKEVLKGQKLVDVSTLQRLITKKAKSSSFRVGKLNLVKDFETRHTLITGTTGVGKTNCFNKLVEQLRDQNQKAIILDTTGNFIERFYDDTKDKILNPFDSRTENWNLWKDCSKSYEFDALAACLIQKTGGDAFWSDSARTLFCETAKKFKDYPQEEGLKEFSSFLLSAPLSKLYSLLKNTPASSLVDPSSEKTAQSIRAHLSFYLKGLAYPQNPSKKDLFSLKEWASNAEESGFLFISTTPSQREALKPLITAWFGVCVNALMEEGEDITRRLWFMIDELASLNKIDSLARALAELRKYGGCVVAGLQDTAQLLETYGHATTRTLLSLFNTKITFRLGDTQTAKTFCELYGEHEIREKNEGVTFGANDMRDGVSFNEHKSFKPIITASDFLSLNDLNAYLKMPGDLPLTKLTFRYKKFEILSPAYCEMPEPPTLEDISNVIPLYKKEKSLDSLKEESEQEFIPKEEEVSIDRGM